MKSNSVCNRTSNYLGVHFVNHEYDYRLNWMTGSPVTNKLLIVTITIISKKTHLLFFCERAFNTNNLSTIKEDTFGRDTV